MIQKRQNCSYEWKWKVNRSITLLGENRNASPLKRRPQRSRTKVALQKGNPLNLEMFAPYESSRQRWTPILHSFLACKLCCNYYRISFEKSFNPWNNQPSSLVFYIFIFKLNQSACFIYLIMCRRIQRIIWILM